MSNEELKLLPAKSSPAKHKGGSTSAFWKNKEIVAKLEAAFANDATIEQACFEAKIAPSRYWNYKKKNQEAVNAWEMLSQQNQLKAKSNIVARIYKGDIELSKWYLERRSNEFMPKQKQHLADAEGDKLDVPSVIAEAINRAYGKGSPADVSTSSAGSPRPVHGG